MNQESGIRNFYYPTLFASLIIIDQFSKYLIRHFGGFYICNKNIAWGIEIPGMLFWGFWITIIAILLLAIWKRRFMPGILCLMLILSGAISNIIDRLCCGCVTDFISLGFWPVFNLADSFIVLGGILLLAKYLKT